MTTRRSFLLHLTSSIPIAYGLDDLADAPAFFPQTASLASGGYEKLATQNGNLPVPEGKRIPFGWEYFAVPSSDSGLVFTLSGLGDRFEGDLFLRLMIAVDTRNERTVSVLLAQSGTKIGEIPVWYASALQLFECQLNATPTQLKKEGIRLVQNLENDPLYLVASSKVSGSHVVKGSAQPPATVFLEAFCSYRSLHPFGWMEGCTMDGLLELERSGRSRKAKKTLDRHLRLFAPDPQQLIYENPNTQPSDNRFNNVEAGLPFVVIADRYPRHAAIQTFLEFCRSRVQNGQVNGPHITTEGCYTLAYPLAAVGKATDSNECYELALLELDQRISSLTDAEAVYQKAALDQSSKSFRNWGRGYTWFLMGLVRTAAIVQQNKEFAADPRLKRVREAFVYYATLALKHQQPDHSWRAFIDLPETGFDASATAGLGASLLYGKKIGWLPELPDSRLYSIRERLEQSLTPDGFLKNCCQINRGGEALQKSDYRVISQYVMGLMAHLYAHLK